MVQIFFIKKAKRINHRHNRNIPIGFSELLASICILKTMRLVLIILFIPTIGIPQPLDNISTTEQAEEYIINNFRYYTVKYDKFTILQSDTIDFDTFSFGDFNHDGFKDLLIFGTAEVSKGKENYIEDELLIILGGKKRTKKVRFPCDYFGYLFYHAIPYPKLISVNRKDYIQIRYDFYNRTDRTNESFIDTVSIKYDHLIPYTENPSEHEVSRIEFKTDYCFGPCPVFELNINRNGEVDYDGIDHVIKKGNHILRINTKDWDYLETLMKHIKIEELQENYNVMWTDDQTGYLKVFFKDGDIKQIEDYGMVGTFGLSILFDFLFELRKF